MDVRKNRMKRKLKYGNYEIKGKGKVKEKEIENTKIIIRKKYKKVKIWTEITTCQPHYNRKTIGNMRKSKRKLKYWYTPYKKLMEIIEEEESRGKKVIEEISRRIRIPRREIEREGIHPIIWNMEKEIKEEVMAYIYIYVRPRKKEEQKEGRRGRGKKKEKERWKHTEEWRKS